jgi:hypothetical protein
MSIFSTPLFADSIVTITPAEPATLQLALVGLVTLATYGVLSGWRFRKSTRAVVRTLPIEHKPAAHGSSAKTRRRAA